MLPLYSSLLTETSFHSPKWHLTFAIWGWHEASFQWTKTSSDVTFWAKVNFHLCSSTGDLRRPCTAQWHWSSLSVWLQDPKQSKQGPPCMTCWIMSQACWWSTYKLWQVAGSLSGAVTTSHYCCFQRSPSVALTATHVGGSASPIVLNLHQHGYFTAVGAIFLLRSNNWRTFLYIENRYERYRLIYLKDIIGQLRLAFLF